MVLCMPVMHCLQLITSCYQREKKQKLILVYEVICLKVFIHHLLLFLDFFKKCHILRL